MIRKIKNIFKVNLNSRQIKATDPQIAEINKFKKEYKGKSFEKMRERIEEIRNELKPFVDKIPSENKQSLVKVDRSKGLPKEEEDLRNKLFEYMPEVYAMLNEVYRRKGGGEYHEVQLRAGIILAQGQRLVEQYTGEG